MRTNGSTRGEAHNEKLHRVRKDPKPKRNVRSNNKPIRFPKGTVVCPFDPCHIIDESYLDRHIVNCASSCNSENSLRDVKPSKHAGVVPLEACRNLTVPVMEDWENEEVSTYDPYINTQGRQVIRYLVLVPKAEKKLFRQTERLRIQLLDKAAADGSNKEVCDLIKNLGQDSLWEILITYMRRLDIECCETLVQNLDFEKLVVSEPSSTSEKENGSKVAEQVLNIEIDKLVISAEPNATRGRRQSLSDAPIENSGFKRATRVKAYIEEKKRRLDSQILLHSRK